MHLSHLVYFSKRVPCSAAALDDIFEVARRNNARAGVTGALFVQRDYFFQLLEGPRAPLSDVFAKIVRDPRHQAVELALFEALNYRMFADWRMAELSEDNPDVRRIYASFVAGAASPHALSGPVMWHMVEKMSTAVLRAAPAG